MRVISWNVWWRFGGQWRARQRGIHTTLASLRPDLVGLQECWGNAEDTQAERLAADLGMYSAFVAPSLPPPPPPPPPVPTETPDQDGFEVGVGVLSRWPVLGIRRTLLPARHRFRPVALVATVDHPAGPLHFAVACLEWEPDFADDHLAQTRALAGLLTDPALDGNLPVLLAADLNAPPGSPELKPLTDVLVDTWVAGGGDPTAVTLSSKHPDAPLRATKQLDQRIDYVLARPGRARQRVSVSKAFVVDEPVDDLYPSDHFPVVVDLDFTR